jgi:hypothetical protein
MLVYQRVYPSDFSLLLILELEFVTGMYYGMIILRASLSADSMAIRL